MGRASAHSVFFSRLPCFSITASSTFHRRLLLQLEVAVRMPPKDAGKVCKVCQMLFPIFALGLTFSAAAWHTTTTSTRILIRPDSTEPQEASIQFWQDFSIVRYEYLRRTQDTSNPSGRSSAPFHPFLQSDTLLDVKRRRHTTRSKSTFCGVHS